METAISVDFLLFPKHLFLFAVSNSTNAHQNLKIDPINIKRTIYNISKTWVIGCQSEILKRRHYSSLTDIEMKGLWVGSILKDNSVLG